MSKRRKQKKTNTRKVKNTQKLELSPLEKGIACAIPLGQFNARTTQEIADRVGVSVRTIRSIVNRLIIKHKLPICGSKMGKRGLYYPLTDEERSNGIEPLRDEVIEMQTRIKTVSMVNLSESLLVIHNLKEGV